MRHDSAPARRCGSGAPGLGPPLAPSHICAATGLSHAQICTPGLGRTPATSAAGPGSPLPHLHRDQARAQRRTHRHLHVSAASSPWAAAWRAAAE
jgi:hypothetical protein